MTGRPTPSAARTPAPTRAGAFVVVTGPDGAGKTTALRYAAASRPHWRVGSYEPGDWLPHPALPHFDWMLQRHPRTVHQQLSPASRAALVAGLILGHVDTWLRPALDAGQTVLLDSYYLRFYAKEKVLGVVPAWFFEAFADLPVPDGVVQLELPLPIAFGRRPGPGPFEVDGPRTYEAYERFQQRVGEQVRALCAQLDCPVHSIDASAPVQTVGQALIAAVEQRLLRPGRRAGESDTAGGTQPAASDSRIITSPGRGGSS